MDDMECEVNAVKDEESVKNEEQDEDNLRGDEATADMVEPDGRGPNRGGGTGIIILERGGTAFASWEGGLEEIGELDVALRSTAAEQADSVSVVDNSELVDAENNDGTSSAEAGQKGAIRDPTTQEAEVKPPCDSIFTVGELYVLETGFEHSVPASIDVTPEPDEYAKELEERLYPLVGIEFKWILKENAEAVEDPSIVDMDKFLDVPMDTLQRTREASPAGSSSPEYWKGWYNGTQESSVEAKRADRDF
ncbi:hypothetical protein PR003_g22774 [Phytophthora rubi]|uniref:Uncharacterized protein n=1 Tax=Phytophthora rubi TaxID=129364 RepID=A0A6A4D5D5_9STRA|nr:hypothetical protein PR003_g22774 [Phytophthora rubi]